MKQRKQALFASLVMLVVAALAMTSVSYAWFTSGTAGTVDNFQFSAQAASGVEFSVNGSDWKSTITASDIANAISTDFQDGSKFANASTFAAISTIDSATSGVFTFYTAEQQADAKFNTSQYSGDGYYRFNLYVKNSGSETKYLDLDATGSTKTSVGTASGTSIKLHLATRIGFIDNGSVSQGSMSIDGWTGAAKVLANGEAVKIYEPNQATHLYLVNSSSQLTYAGIKASGSSITGSNGFVTDSNYAQQINSSNLFDDIDTAASHDTKTSAASNTVATLDPNSITKLTVFVWIEGQDADCLNEVSGGTVDVKLFFNAVNKTSN